MIQTAVTDIIGPAVAAKGPEALFDQLIPVFQDILAKLAFACFQQGKQFGCGCNGGFPVIVGSQPFLESFPQRLIQRGCFFAAQSLLHKGF